MGHSKVRPIKIRGRRLVLTEKIILDAQEYTKSNMEAARWIGVSYNTYKKWAKYYNLFEKHLNQEGVGIKKGWASYRIPVDDILNGKRNLPKNYSFSVLKNRLIEDGYFQNECSHCGYNEVNLLMDKVCISLDFIDGNNKNLNIDNLRLLCPNCYLSFNGSFSKSKVLCK